MKSSGLRKAAEKRMENTGSPLTLGLCALLRKNCDPNPPTNIYAVEKEEYGDYAKLTLICVFLLKAHSVKKKNLNRHLI